MKELRRKQGFTLVELLIVVAIVAILIAIGIPVFSTVMERARETVDLANMRAAYAEYMSDALLSKTNDYVDDSTSPTQLYKTYSIPFKQKQQGWVVPVDEIPFVGASSNSILDAASGNVVDNLYVWFTPSNSPTTDDRPVVHAGKKLLDDKIPGFVDATGAKGCESPGESLDNLS